MNQNAQALREKHSAKKIQKVVRAHQQAKREDAAAKTIQSAFKNYATRIKTVTPNVTAQTRQHVHIGDSRGDEAGQGKGLWDGGGLHSWGGLQRRMIAEKHQAMKNTGNNNPSQGLYTHLQREQTDSSGVIQVVAQKANYGTDLKPEKFSGGKKGHKKNEPYTLYPKGTSPLQSDLAAQRVMTRALLNSSATDKAKREQTQRTSYTAPHAPQLGKFSGYGTVKDGEQKRLIKIEGHVKPDGNMSSHYPIKSTEADSHLQKRYQKWASKNNWQKLQQLGMISQEEAEQMKAKVKGQRARKYTNFLKR